MVKQGRFGEAEARKSFMGGETYGLPEVGINIYAYLDYD